MIQPAWTSPSCEVLLAANNLTSFVPDSRLCSWLSGVPKPLAKRRPAIATKQAALKKSGPHILSPLQCEKISQDLVRVISLRLRQ